MENLPRALRQPFFLKVTTGIFLGFWCLLAVFPIFWIAVMRANVGRRILLSVKTKKCERP